MKISAGHEILDELLNGGYEKDIINTIYGPAASAKTLLCILAMINIARDNKKVVYIDTEGGFSVERLKQIADDYEKILDNVIFLKPVSFEEQKNAFEKLRRLVNDKIGLIIVDSLSMLYRLEIGKTKDVYDVNRELGLQLSYLSEIARLKNIPVLITNQVYADFENKDGVKIVGGDLLKYGSKCMIELRNAKAGHRRALLKKHRSIKESKVDFKIIKEGIEKIEEKEFIPL